MVSYLETLLQEKTKGKKDEILFTQWQIAKDYVPQVLATISNIFPHYTLHDKSHSEAILTNISRIIKKETFEKFSSIDLWLLLCCAFYHDIGMVAFASDLNKLLNENDFLNYLYEMQKDENHILHANSKYFEIKEKKIHFKNSEVSLEKIESLKFILAEYIRYAHSRRSEKALDKEPSMYLPNNPIPQRLIKILGKICECHTESFEKLLELPFSEMGIDYDECHPRYIACLLRLGDLLDLDNNRVSDIVLQTVTKIPTESYFHIKKHLSISHIQMNSTQIDITAECEEYRTADLVSSWFSWLNSKMTNQMKNWNNIVPANDYGFLPTLENLKVDLKDYDTINGKLHPRFEIDTQKAMEMLQGAGFYNEPYQSIREILQNSVDATYFRIWLENKSKCKRFTKKEFETECKKEIYSIKISIKKGEILKSGEIIWHISISDSGIGMSKDDLGFLCKTGSSSRNTEKQKMLSEMPEWMKPSGTFGIGFQSIFLLTDKVHIKTRKYNRENIYDVDLYSPTGKDKGTVLVKTSSDTGILTGTTLSFDFAEKKIPESISISTNRRLSNYSVFEYDFVESESFDYDICKIIDEIIQFSRASYIQLSLKLDDGSNNYTELITPNKTVDFSYYSEKTNLEITIKEGENPKCAIFYRNQYVSLSPFWFNFLQIHVNILGGNAKEILSLSRNEINSKYVNILQKDIISTIIDYIENKFSTFSPKMKQLASMFVCVYKDVIGIKSDNSEIFTEWEMYCVDVEENGKTQQLPLKSVLDSVDEVRIKHINSRVHNNIYKIDGDILFIDFYSGFQSSSNDEARFFYSISSHIFKNISYVDENGIEYILSKTKKLNVIGDSGWKSWLSSVYLENWTARGMIPCNNEYADLAIADTFHAPYTWGLGIPNGYSYLKMISPYIIKHDGFRKRIVVSISDKLINTVYDNRKNVSSSKEKIRDVYEKFISDRQNIIDEINNDSENLSHKVGS
jgi:septum formation topological specificity factor MinE